MKQKVRRIATAQCPEIVVLGVGTVPACTVDPFDIISSPGKKKPKARNYCGAIRHTEGNDEGFGTGDFGNTWILLLKNPVASHSLRVVQEKRFWQDSCNSLAQHNKYCSNIRMVEFVREENSVISVQVKENKKWEKTSMQVMRMIDHCYRSFVWKPIREHFCKEPREI
ncbi:hypothetical protein M5K25_016965 [Dendrobium thyrsiflorum]|uniref:Uncharacterized protein n=1 Tax=Dendrobium thyrsiflorum TaxID=117978 RepID=A0ABD0ULH7_DENTH